MYNCNISYDIKKFSCHFYRLHCLVTISSKPWQYTLEITFDGEDQIQPLELSVEVELGIKVYFHNY